MRSEFERLIPVPTTVPDSFTSGAGFYMAEMDSAALDILRKVVKFGTWSVTVRLDTCADVVGFCNLLHAGYLGPNTHNVSAHGEWFVTASFIDRVVA